MLLSQVIFLKKLLIGSRILFLEKARIILGRNKELIITTFAHTRKNITVIFNPIKIPQCFWQFVKTADGNHLTGIVEQYAIYLQVFGGIIFGVKVGDSYFGTIYIYLAAIHNKGIKVGGLRVEFVHAEVHSLFKGV